MESERGKKGKKSAEIWNTSLRHNGKQKDACKEKEEERKAHDHLFNEWEHIEQNIQQLSNALAIETNELLKQDVHIVVFI